MPRLTSFVRLLVLVYLVVSCVRTDAKTGTPARPNILLIMADDLGFSDLGCYGSEIATPNLDALAESGLQFTQFYNTARCWPTRGSLLTGYYAQQIRRDTLPGIPSGGGNRGKRQDWAVLLPRMLESQGYRSYHTGKWHIDGMPIANGFDHSYLLKDQGRFFNPTRHWKDDVQLPSVKKGTDFYATTALADHVIEVLQDHATEHGDKPFFHYLAFAAPHFPLHALPQDIAIYEDTYHEGWDAIRRKRWKRLQQQGLLNDKAVTELSRVERNLGPPYHFPEALKILGEGEVNRPMPWKLLSKEQQQFQATKMSIHAAMIHRMDIEIGRVFEQLKKMDQWENTLVIFLSDNGASAEIMVRDDGHDSNLSAGSAGTYLCLGPGWSTTCNTPFRRHKTWTHEGGISTPLVVSWPNGIAARGEVRRDVGHVVDIVPTVLELSGASRRPDAPPSPGKSMVASFDKAGDLQHDSLWWFHDGHKAIRVGDWKAVAPIGEPWELYNLAIDRNESTDLAVPEADRLGSLVNEWQRQRDSFIKLASHDLPQNKSGKQTTKNTKPTIKPTQRDAMPKRKQVLLGGESFLLKDRHAFLMKPDKHATSDTGKPWIFYGPTLSAYPDQAESWMHQQFLDAGIAVAGIDVGEAYGSPKAFPFFAALHDEMLRRGYSKTPALLGRSRGGLWVSSWAIEHPDRVAAIGGIYPVYDYTTYPGVKRAATAYGVSAEQLQTEQDVLNPIKRADSLAKARIPVLIIHGKDDKVVPLAENSGALENIYQANGAGDLIEVIKIDGQGHNFWPGFFHCQKLVDFLIEQAK
ncbi:MAG: sulfatase-like hydrolase/transferase [Rubripirellula sp.]|nr:sulfatase-like hydrolase/transferase [Rubripirellula sp.]